MHLHWHRRDLRVPDNRALAAAVASAPVTPVFVLDPTVLRHGSPPRIGFLLDCLRSLRADYREVGSELLLTRGEPAEVLPALATDLDADRIVWNRDHSGLARERDATVRRALAEADIDHESFHDALLFEPGSITTNEGTHYRVFSYFWRKWRERAKRDPVEVDTTALVDPESDAHGAGERPTLHDLGVEEPDVTLPDAGTAAARKRLDAFVDGPIYRYADRRDVPADEGTSRLSPDLKWGTIGIREVYRATEGAMAAADGTDEEDSVEAFRSQLAWREFYAHVLAANPEVVTENFVNFAQPIEWRHDPDGLRAWKDGETGYPLVDAGMRQLRRDAWMHNRVRMVVASFLTKDLLIDWRAGYDWFRRRLIDHDTANDTGGWQWAASTGTDAQPYFRVFNPTTQCERFDPDGEYVREYVPELRDAPTDVIHDWPSLSDEERREHAPNYPEPIVDHAERREEAIETFERARG